MTNLAGLTCVLSEAVIPSHWGYVEASMFVGLFLYAYMLICIIYMLILYIVLSYGCPACILY